MRAFEQGGEIVGLRTADVSVCPLCFLHSFLLRPFISSAFLFQIRYALRSFASLQGKDIPLDLTLSEIVGMSSDLQVVFEGQETPPPAAAAAASPSRGGGGLCSSVCLDECCRHQLPGHILGDHHMDKLWPPPAA